MMLKKIYRYGQRFLSSLKTKPSHQHPQPSSNLIRVIIGNGVAGVEAAKTLRRLDQHCRIIIISEESVLHWSRPALMYIFMDELSFAESCPYPVEWFVQKRIELIQDKVLRVNRSEQKLLLSNHPDLSYHQLLIACGSQPTTLDQIPLSLDDVFGFYHLQDSKLLKQKTQHAQTALIIGGGLIAVELAEILLHEGIKVDVVIQDPLFAAHILPKEEAEFITEYLRQEGLRLHCSTQVKELIILEQDSSHHANTDTEQTQSLDQNNSVDSSQLVIQNSNPKISPKQIILTNNKTIDAELILIAIGVEPAAKHIAGLEDLTRRGVLVGPQLQSADPKIFAAGDCAERVLDTEQIAIENQLCSPALVSSTNSFISGTWYEAKAMGKVAAHAMHRAQLLQDSSRDSTLEQSEIELSKVHIYEPLTHQWFNSTKYFQIEYQEYGQCLNSLNQKDFPELNSCFYLNNDKQQSLRLFYKDQVLTGICSLGIRLRQTLCHTWLKEERSILNVIESLELLNFNPEFDTSIHHAQQALLAQYKSKINT